MYYLILSVPLSLSLPELDYRSPAMQTKKKASPISRSEIDGGITPVHDALCCRHMPQNVIEILFHHRRVQTEQQGSKQACGAGQCGERHSRRGSRLLPAHARKCHRNLVSSQTRVSANISLLGYQVIRLLLRLLGYQVIRLLLRLLGYQVIRLLLRLLGHQVIRLLLRLLGYQVVRLLGY